MEKHKQSIIDNVCEKVEEAEYPISVLNMVRISVYDQIKRTKTEASKEWLLELLEEVRFKTFSVLKQRKQ